jgi:hypothetical protein
MVFRIILNYWAGNEIMKIITPSCFSHFLNLCAETLDLIDVCFESGWPGTENRREPITTNSSSPKYKKEYVL